MLQWMGGSRRKVTTSRKSMQKRQKQYFEERKRQQQQHKSSGLESYYDKKVPSRHCQENNRSLDVLSLLNLSKDGQACTSRIPEGRESSNNEHPTPNYQTVHCPNTIQRKIKSTCPSEPVEIRETRIASKDLEETVCPHDSNASERNNVKDAKKTSPDHKLSVVDVLSDDGQNSSPRGKFMHENHVAFSVEGLGKVEMGTPVHSPQHPTRNFSYGCPALSETNNRSHSFKNLYCTLENDYTELDHMAAGVDIPTDPSAIEFPPYFGESGRIKKQKTMGVKECLMHDATDFLSNDDFELNDSRVEEDNFIWHETEKWRGREETCGIYQRECFTLSGLEKSCFLDDSFVDDNRGASWKNWPYDFDSETMIYLRNWTCDKPDISFEDFHIQKRRASVKEAGCFNVSGLCSSYMHQMEHAHDFRCDMTSYPTIDGKYGFSEMANCSAWSSFATEDARDQFSFSSEDSCLSRAVWREGTKKPSVKSTERQKIRGREADYRGPVNIFNMKKNTSPPELCTKGFDTLLEQSQNYSALCNRKSTPGDGWFFGEQHNTENAKPGYASISTYEKTPKVSWLSCKSWNAEPFDSDFNLKMYVDEIPSTSRSEHDAFSGNLFSDRVASCQQVSPGLSPNINVECGHQESFGDLFNEEKECSKIQFQESVSTGENKPVTPPTMLHPNEDTQRNPSSSTNETPVKDLNSEDTSLFAESIVNTKEMMPGPTVVLSPVSSEGGSSSVEMPQKLEACDGL